MTNDMPPAATTVTGLAPLFLVDDVERTAGWYRDVLGFTIGDYFRGEHEHDADGNDVTLGDVEFVILSRDGHRLMLSKTHNAGDGVHTNRAAKAASCDAYIWVRGIDAMFAQAKDAGANIVEPMENRVYGVREFVLEDHDGRIVTLGEIQAGD